jgi:flagellar hook-length control protein FliK
MPTQVQNNIVLPPIQKFVPPPEPPAQDAAPRRGEEFGEALKTARKKADAPDKTQPAKEKTKDAKTESKKDKDNDSKATGKSSAKSATKAAQSAKSSKPVKSKAGAHDDAGEIDDTDAAEQAEDPAAADQAAQTAATDETETPATTPQTKPPAIVKDDPDHADQTDSTAAAATAASAHLVQAVDRAKDQTKREKNPDETPDADENAATTVQAVTTTAAKTAASSATPSADDARATVKTEAPATQTVSNATHTKAASIDLGGDAPIEIKPSAATKPLANTNDPAATTDASTQLPLPPESPDAPPADAKVEKLSLDLDPIARAVLESQGHATQSAGQTASPKTADAPPPPPEVQFAQSNHDNIVKEVQTQLLPHGGTMEIRLDPPELGALKVMVEMRDGVMSATFQTSSEEATQLLSHSLNQLKHVLESQGVNVERLQVQQAPKSDSSNTKDDPNQRQQQGSADDHAARQEQQRKEMMRRMWRRVSGAGDPIDYLA